MASASSLPIHIIIDTREHDLISLFSSRPTTAPPISWSTASLPLGDVVFVPSGRASAPLTELNELLLIERKSVADLASSIQDGRYNEQSLRLHHHPLHNHNIIYLIEGNVATYQSRYSRIDASALHSAVFSLLFYKGFSTIQTANLAATYEWITRAYMKISREMERKDGKVPFYGVKGGVGGGGGSSREEDTSVLTEHATELAESHPRTAMSASASASPSPTNIPTAYTDVLIKRVKNQNITPDNIGVILLSQIPGISSTIAEIIMREFSTISDFIDFIRANPDYLSCLTYETKAGQKRHIPKPAVENIRRFLLRE